MNRISTYLIYIIRTHWDFYPLFCLPYEALAASLHCLQSIASLQLQSLEALHASKAKLWPTVGSSDETQIQYCEFFSVYCNFIFSCYTYQTRSLRCFHSLSVAKFYCPVPTPASHEWSAPRQIFLRGQGHSGVIFIILYRSL